MDIGAAAPIGAIGSPGASHAQQQAQPASAQADDVFARVCAANPELQRVFDLIDQQSNIVSVDHALELWEELERRRREEEQLAQMRRYLLGLDAPSPGAVEAPGPATQSIDGPGRSALVADAWRSATGASPAAP